MTEELVDRAKSLQVLQDWLAGDRNFQPKFSLTTARSIVANDPLVSAALETEANKVTEGGWGIKDGRKASNSEKRFRKKYRFNNTLHTLARNLRWQDGLIEIARDDNEIVGLNLLDQAVLEVNAKPNGDVTEYYQEEVQIGSRRTWDAKNVVHIKLKDAILNIWGESDLRVAYETVMVKDYIRKFLSWLFGTNQFRNHIGFKQTVSEEQVKKFISYYKEGEHSYGKPAITDGDVEIKALRELKDLENIILILDYCDKELMRLLQQTPLSMGEGGSSGRSEADGMSDVQRTSVKAVQRVIADAINYELFPKMGLPDSTEFYWKPLDRMSETKIFELVEIMKRSMFTDEAIIEFMEQQGMSFETKKLFKEPELAPAGMPTPEQRSQKDASASRERKGAGESNKRIGTGEAGTTRKDQLVARDNNQKYWEYTAVLEDEE